MIKNPSLIKTEKLVKSYGEIDVVKGVDLKVSSGEIVGLLGPNGAGKTTSFYMIVGLKQTKGKVFFKDQDVTHLPMFQRARMGMGYLPKSSSVFRKLTVEENVMAILETLPISKAERKRRLDVLLEKLNISHLAKQKAFTLSGGERRRLEITRALVTEPSLLLLDELYVDPLAISDVQDIVKGLQADGLGILITDHNVRETLEVVDRAYLLCDGEIVCEGDQDFLVNDPKSKELYLGPEI